MPYNISLFVSDGVVSVHWKLSVSTEIGRTQFWWYEILGILILIPHMIYYIHITIDYIDSSIHLVTLPEYRKVILWYTKWYNPINKNRIMTVLFASR